MAESYGFFDAEELLDGTFDREYIAQQWADYFRLFIGNGVFATPTNQLKVRSIAGMRIKVLEGWAFLNGYWYHNDGDFEITVPPNLTANEQNHGVFVQFNSSDRTIGIVLGENRTEVDRTAPIWELKLGEVKVPAGATSVTESNITDTRAATSVCGFVTGLIDIINTEDLFTQYQSIFNDWIAEVEAEEAQKSEEFDDWRQTEQQTFEDWEVTQKSEFDGWFDDMKGQLSTDAAGHLQNQIDDLNGAIVYVELTSTASRDYAVDESIYWEGAFYRVKTAVTLGDAWDNTANTGNIEPMIPIVTQIKNAYDALIARYDPDNDGIIDISHGGTGNNSGYVTAGRNPGSVAGANSTCEGYLTAASGANSHAEGYQTQAHGSYSHTEGDRTFVPSNAAAAHAEGSGSQAVGKFSHAEGNDTQARGESSHAEGRNTIAKGFYSHAGGYNTKAEGIASFIGGYGTIGSPVESFAFASFTMGNSSANKFEGTNLGNNNPAYFDFNVEYQSFYENTELDIKQNGHSGEITGITTVTLDLAPQAMYILLTSTYTLANGNIQGTTARMITTHGLATGTPINASMSTSGTPATIAFLANNKMTIKNAAATTACQFTLIRVL